MRCVFLWYQKSELYPYFLLDFHQKRTTVSRIWLAILSSRLRRSVGDILFRWILCGPYRSLGSRYVCMLRMGIYKTSTSIFISCCSGPSWFTFLSIFNQKKKNGFFCKQIVVNGQMTQVRVEAKHKYLGLLFLVA